MTDDDFDLQAEWRKRNPLTADDLRRSAETGLDVRASVEREFTHWSRKADRLAARAAERETKGLALMASDARALARARTQAGEFARLLSDFEPVHRLPANERFPTP